MYKVELTFVKVVIKYKYDILVFNLTYGVL